MIKKILSDWEWSSIPENYSEVSILFCSDSFIHKLNRDYRNKDKPTDVLSFAQSEGLAADFSSSIGDLVISLDTARIQAKKFKHSLNRELQRLLIHGLLHLLGFDHENVTPAEAQKMRRLERKLMRIYADEKSK
jgi:probable rRNA maturation factor